MNPHVFTRWLAPAVLFLTPSTFGAPAAQSSSYAERTGEQGSAQLLVTNDPKYEITQQAKLLANNAGFSDLFGDSVAVDGDTAVVGAYNKGTGKGTAYVYTRSNSIWSQAQQLQPSGAATNDWTGYDVAIAGDTIVLGAPLRDPVAGIDAGAVYVFVLCGGSWVEQQVLLASNGAPGDRFGWSVDVDADHIVVGASWADPTGDKSGEAYVFGRVDGGNSDPCDDSWCEQSTLAGIPALPNSVLTGDEFGYAVAVDGDAVVIGAHLDDSPAISAGAVHVFRLDDKGTSTPCDDDWTVDGYLVGETGAASDQFGCSVDIKVDSLIVGALGDDTGGGNAGAAYVFEYNAPTWTRMNRMLAPEPAASDTFGHSVAIDAFAVVGCPLDNYPSTLSDIGTAHFFKRGPNKWNWKAQFRTCDSAGGDLSGTSVAISDLTVLVGTPGDDDAGLNFNSGSAAAFEVLDDAGNDFSTFALGDGSEGDCPCTPANNSQLDYGEGCLNSSGTHGAMLGPLGSCSVAKKDFELVACNLNSGVNSIVFGSQTAGTPFGFGAGLRGVLSPVVRFGVKTSSTSGMAIWQGMETKGQWTPGQTWYFQTWYRDPSGPCATTNLSNGVSVNFCP